LFSAVDDTGTNLDQETCEKLFRCAGQVEKMLDVPVDLGKRLTDEMQRHADAVTVKNLEENNKHFIEARDSLDKWAADMELAAGKELDDVKRRIQELQRQSRHATTLEEQNTLQSSIAELERKKKSLRQKIFDLDDEIAEKRDFLIEQLEKRMKQKTSTTLLFTIRWKVV
jgi:predicted  nucleic acid-binding Zn-ribbon protein